MPSRPLKVFVAIVFVCGAAAASSQQSGPSADATRRAVTAADAFFSTLTPAQRAKANLDLNEKTRTVWSNLPTGIAMQVGATERNGLKLGDMTPPQEKAALALVAAVLSRDGYQKAMQVVDADQLLEERSAPTRKPGSQTRFGRAEYYVAILGKPSTTDLWMIQFGGHHLAINVTVAAGQNVLAPTHTGAQPASYQLEGRMVRPLGDENDKAFALVNALDAMQRSQAILPYRVSDLVLGPGQDGRTIQPEGIRASSLSSAQQTMLLDIVREWAGIMNDAFGEPRMNDIRAKLADTYFAWSGPLTNGSAAYFRIQGPTLVIEYAPQGGVDHIHTIYRDPTNDYGAQFARR